MKSCPRFIGYQIFIINELGTEFVIVSAAIRAEFIEFKIKIDGILCGLRVFFFSNSASPVQTVYDFLAVEVKKDDLVVLHLRTSDPSSIDEFRTNLTVTQSTVKSIAN
jgi:hypothetical protein